MTDTLQDLDEFTPIIRLLILRHVVGALGVIAGPEATEAAFERAINSMEGEDGTN